MLVVQGLGFLCYVAVVGYTSLGAVAQALPLRRWLGMRPVPCQRLADAVSQVGTLDDWGSRYIT
jgi:hypothetical protein